MEEKKGWELLPQTSTLVSADEVVVGPWSFDMKKQEAAPFGDCGGSAVHSGNFINHLVEAATGVTFREMSPTYFVPYFTALSFRFTHWYFKFFQ